MTASPMMFPLRHAIILSRFLLFDFGTQNAGQKSIKTMQKPILFMDTTQLAFGPVKVGDKPSQQITIRNSGGQSLQWQTSVNNPEWITPDPSQNSNGLPAGQSQTINVIADTSRLSSNLSPYSGIITFTSNGGTKIVSITLNLVAPQVQPMLCLDTQTLDFGTLTVGDIRTQQIMVSNCGGQSLTWNADPGNASWVTPDTTSGTLNAGQSQTINVTIYTYTLTPGSNPATISFNANGGSKTVSITLTGIPVPTVTATLSLPCLYDVGAGWSCSATVTPDANNQSDVTWMSSSSGINGIYVTPSGSTLPPGSPMSITISIPDGICPAAATINIYSSANQVPLSWHCPAPTFTASGLMACPPATATAIASTATAIAATPASYLDCKTVTLTEDSTSQGELSWNAYSDKSGVSFYPASGLLYPGNPVTVTIAVPYDSQANFIFVGPANKTSVPCNCASPVA